MPIFRARVPETYDTITPHGSVGRVPGKQDVIFQENKTRLDSLQTRHCIVRAAVTESLGDGPALDALVCPPSSRTSGVSMSCACAYALGRATDFPARPRSEYARGGLRNRIGGDDIEEEEEEHDESIAIRRIVKTRRKKRHVERAYSVKPVFGRSATRARVRTRRKTRAGQVHAGGTGCCGSERSGATR